MNFLTHAELVEAVESVALELENERELDAVYIPPEVDCLTDEEKFDEQIAGRSGSPSTNDIAGTFELHGLDSASDSEITSQPPRKKKKKNIRQRNSAAGKNPRWCSGECPYDRSPISLESEKLEKIKDTVLHLTPLELFFKFLDDDMQDMIVNYSLKYAKDNNRHDFTFTKVDLLQFIGILLFYGYHKLPQTQLYWSTQEDMGLKIIKTCMSRNKFYNIKRNLHLSDNDTLNKSDKYTKIRPFIDRVNTNNMQFGVFADNLSIDEQMVPYFGRHSCKMFIKGKPVRFGFKLWCLCSHDGYLFNFSPYAGARPDKSEYGLGGDVVINLLSVLKNKESHTTYFDNFFSSYKLLQYLTHEGYYVTGTIRENRVGNCPLQASKAFHKSNRGTYENAYDKNSKISIVRWNDNAVVTVISNCNSTSPLQSARRYNRKFKAVDTIEQPYVIARYNKFMGGVDLHDNGIANYRINIMGKKWWWPLFTNILDSIVVNCWKVYNIGHISKPISQLQTKSYIAYRLLKLHSKPSIQSLAIPKELRTSGQHLVDICNGKIRNRSKVCKSNTIYICFTCNVHVHRKCFDLYHNI